MQKKYISTVFFVSLCSRTKKYVTSSQAALNLTASSANGAVLERTTRTEVLVFEFKSHFTAAIGLNLADSVDFR